MSEKVKLLFIMHVPPPVHGAAMMGSYVKNSAVINDVFDTTYINLATSTQLSETGKAGLSKLIVFFRLVSKVLRTLLKGKFNLCHISLTASGPGFYKDLVILAMVKMAGVKIIYHFHNKGIADASKSWLNSLLYKFAFKGTQSILLSPHLYPDLKQYVDEFNVYYCPNGIPETVGANELGKAKPFVDEPATFLYLSNMMREKGALVLLEAMQKLKERQLDFRCHFVGAWADIRETDFLLKVEESGLSEIVTAHGARYGQEKEAFFGLANVFIFPTFYHYEAFPLVCLEAMQHGLAVVSTPEGGIPDIVKEGETGFLVPQHDAIWLADKLEILIRDPELRSKMGQEGRKRFLDQFTLRHFEKTLTEILRKAAER